MVTIIKLKHTNDSLVRFIMGIAMLTLTGCGSDNSDAEEKTEILAPPSVPVPVDGTAGFIGSWLSNCGERDSLAYYTHELVLTGDDLAIIQHKFDTSDCSGTSVASISQTNKPYTYPESNSETNDKFIVVEVFKEPLWTMKVNVETYDNLLYLSNNLLITHEGFAFDSSQTSAINYVNYLTKKE